MIRFKPSRLTVAATVAAILIVLAGSGAVASNMGFKMNKAIFPAVSGTPGKGNNLVSLPMNNPYGTLNGLCTQTSLPAGTAVTLKNPETGSQTGALTCTCGIGCPANTTKLDLSTQGLAYSFLGVQERMPVSQTATFSQIIVGSHNPIQPVLLRWVQNDPLCPEGTCTNAGPGQTCANTPSLCCATNANCVSPATCNLAAGVGETWVSVPYHTTAVTANDFCTQAGIPSGQATIVRVAADTGVVTSGLCGFSTANYNLVLGEAVKFRRTSAGPCTRLSFIPAHF